MQIKPGSIIVSTTLLNETNFEQVVIVITEHNEKGTIGFTFNRLFPRVFNELEEFKLAVPVPLYAGGPVQTDFLYFMHCRSDLVTGSDLITGTMYMNGDFKQAVQLLNTGLLPMADVRFFIGYCGWDVNELEAEIEEGSWLLTDEDASLVFSPGEDQLWSSVYHTAVLKQSSGQ